MQVYALKAKESDGRTVSFEVIGRSPANKGIAYKELTGNQPTRGQLTNLVGASSQWDSGLEKIWHSSILAPPQAIVVRFWYKGLKFWDWSQCVLVHWV